MGAGEIDLLLKPDAFGIVAWIEIIMGVFIPYAILFSKLGWHSMGPFWAGVFALIGTFINRVMISWLALAEPTPVVYMPSLIEILITVGLIAGGFLLYGVVVRYYNLHPDHPQTQS